MAAPTAPTQQYDFQNFSTSNPTGQQPGDKLDEEFEHHRATIANIVSFVRTQIADDGVLKGGSIDPDQLSSAVLALLNTTLNFRGAWVTATVYAVGDVVEVTSSSYVCITAHTSGVFATNWTTNSYWQIFAAHETIDATVLADRISGDGTTGPFTLSENMGTDEGVVFVFDSNGNIMDPVTDYTLAGTSLTFASNTTVGTNNYQARSMVFGVAAAQSAAETAQAAAEAAQSAAETAKAAAELAETNAEADAVQTAADRIAVAADLVSTHQDTLDTAADVTAIASDAAQTALDRIATAADKVATNADAATTTQDAIDSAADVVLTNADVVLAEAAKVAAQAAQTAAELAYDNVDDLYLGSKTSDPTVDNDGNALIDGALYYNTTSNSLKAFDLGTTTWIAIGANTDETSKVSANDTTAGYLNGKLVAGSGITLTENTDAGNETLSIINTGPGLGMILALG